MPTTKQRRDAARRRLERQIQRRQEAAAKRRRRNVITASFLSVVVVLGAVWLVWANASGSDSSKKASAASATPTATASARAPKSTSGPCKYAETATTLANKNVKDVGLPADPKPTPATGTAQFALTTNLGAIDIQLDRAKAPCTVQSFAYLAGKKFFDGTKCHRLVTTTIYVLQCGDPSGTGNGGPTYQIKDENLKTASYTRGVVAMANGGANTDGSQFFIIYKDSTKLPKSYTVIGKVTTGLDIVDEVAKAGSNNSNATGDGAPKKAVTIKTASITG